MSTTSRIAYPYPTGADAADVPAWMEDQAVLLDDIMAWDVQGTLASRPAAGKRGRYYTSTDEVDGRVTYRDTGAAWDRITPLPHYACKLVYTGTSFLMANANSSGWRGAIAFDGIWTERYDTHPSGLYVPGSSTSRITFKTAGIWRVWGSIGRGPFTQATTLQTWHADVFSGLRGGASFTRRFEKIMPANSDAIVTTSSVSFSDQFSVNDYLTFGMDWSAALSGNVTVYGEAAASKTVTEWGVEYLGPA